MSTTRLLPSPQPEPSDEQVLDEGVRRLEQRLTEKKRELKQLETMVAATAAKLRVLHLALSAFFGESQEQPVSVGESAGTNLPPNAAAWQMWRERLTPGCGKIIDGLMIQPLTMTQMIKACSMDYSTIKKSMSILRSNTLVEKDGDRWKLVRL